MTSLLNGSDIIDALPLASQMAAIAGGRLPCTYKVRDTVYLCRAVGKRTGGAVEVAWTRALPSDIAKYTECDRSAHGRDNMGHRFSPLTTAADIASRFEAALVTS